MNLKSELLRGSLSFPLPYTLRLLTYRYLGVYAYGFERPSAIQMRAIMPVIKGQLYRHSHYF